MCKSTKTTYFSKVLCDFFGHKYEVTKNITDHVKEYKCRCCNKEFTTNSNGNLTDLTPKYKEINETLARIYSNKLSKSKASRLDTSTSAA